MNKNLVLPIIGLLLTGCSVDRFDVGFSPVKVVNIFYDTLYINDNYGISHNISSLNFDNEYSLSPCYYGKCIEYGYSEETDFYQDSEKKCYLFSINNKMFSSEIRKKQDAIVKEFIEHNELEPRRVYDSSFNEGKERIKLEEGVMIIIVKEKIFAVGKEEYERIKPTLKPHPYDPSLCKPKPINE